MHEPVKTIGVHVEGRVQGVWYRSWTSQQADRLGLNGWVRNLVDNGVQAVFSGPPEQLDMMVKQLWKGPPAAKVTAVTCTPIEDSPGPGFHQLATASSDAGFKI